MKESEILSLKSAALEEAHKQFPDLKDVLVSMFGADVILDIKRADDEWVRFAYLEREGDRDLKKRRRKKRRKKKKAKKDASTA